MFLSDQVETSVVTFVVKYISNISPFFFFFFDGHTYSREITDIFHIWEKKPLSFAFYWTSLKQDLSNIA